MSKTSPKVTPSKGEAEEDGQGRGDSNEIIEIVSKEISEEEFQQLSDIYQSPMKFSQKELF
jgi:hypothetical protein